MDPEISKQMYLYTYRRLHNFVDEFECGRMCYVLKIDDKLFFANFRKDKIEKDYWFADIKNQVVFKATENSNEQAHRIIATANKKIYKGEQRAGYERLLKIPGDFSKEEADFVFLDYNPWEEVFSMEDKRQYANYLQHNTENEVVILRKIKTIKKEIQMQKRSEEELAKIFKESDEKSWKDVADMLYHVCRATYGEEFEHWVEAKYYNKMKDLTGNDRMMEK